MKGYFFEKTKELFIILKKLYLITVGDLIKECKQIIEDILFLSPFGVYHQFIWFGLFSVTNILITEKSTEFYTEKSKEMEKILKEI